MKKLIAAILSVMIVLGLNAVPSLAGTFTPIAQPDAAYLASTTKIDISELSFDSYYSSISDGTLTVSFDKPLLKLGPVPNGWATWSSPPYSESPNPDVLYTMSQSALTMTLSQPCTIFGFELEPNPFADHAYDVDFVLMSGPTVVGRITMTVHGYQGARLFAAKVDGAKFDRIVISGAKEFAIAQIRYAITTVGIRITAPAEGDTFWIEAEPEPRMPTIDCQAKVIGITPDPTATTEFSWEVAVSYTDHGRTDLSRFGPKKSVGGAWRPDFRNVIAGGTVTITATAIIDGKEYEHSVKCFIRGKNPAKQTVKDTLGQLILQVICYKEAYPKWQQFGSSGLPVFGPPNGFGLMQLDPPSSSDQIWSWVSNVQEGRSRWREKIAMSKYHVRQVKIANADQKVPNLSPEQEEREAAYLYRGGSWVDGEFQYYYAWNRNTKQWEVNPKANATSKAYADDAMSIKASVLAGSPPPGW